MTFAIVAEALGKEKDDLPRLTTVNSEVIAKLIGPEMQRFVDQQRRLPDQGRRISVTITPDPATQRIYIDIDASYLPADTKVMTEDFGELLTEVENEAVELLTGIVYFEVIKARIGEKEIHEIYLPGYMDQGPGNKEGAAHAQPPDHPAAMGD